MAVTADSMMYSILEIERTYGDTVSFADKGKSLLKFGKNIDLDTGAFETVWNLGGHETYVTTNAIDTISSSSASDTEVMTIEGHTVSGTGADAQYTFVIQTATLNGQNKVTLGTPVARVSRMFNAGPTDLVGTIYCYEDGAITAGVPDDLTTVHANIVAGENQTFKAATTFSNSDYFVMTSLTVGVRRAQTAVVDFVLEVRQPGGVFLPKVLLTSSQSSGNIASNFSPFIIIPKNSDVRVTAETTANNTTVEAQFQGLIGKVEPSRHSIKRIDLP